MRLPAELYARVEAARGMVKRNGWLVAAVEAALPSDPPAANGPDDVRPPLEEVFGDEPGSGVDRAQEFRRVTQR